MLNQDMVGLVELIVAVGTLAALWIGLNRKPQRRDQPKSDLRK
jgi:hypothetical protein